MCNIPCPENCVVSDWGSFSSCVPNNGICGNGVQTTRRSIVKQPLNGGTLCPSDLTKSQNCVVDCGCLGAPNASQFCTYCKNQVDAYRSAGWAFNTNGFPQCTNPKGSWTSSCINPRITKNGTYWDPSTTFSADCLNNNGIRVNASIGIHNCDGTVYNNNGALFCSKNCEVSNWSNWSNCKANSGTCGTGTQTRTRSVINQKVNNGNDCPSLTETQTCEIPCPVNCRISDWSNWSNCKANNNICGTGTQTSTRTILQQPLNEGTPCPSDLTKSQNCVVDCGCLGAPNASQFCTYCKNQVDAYRSAGWAFNTNGFPQCTNPRGSWSSSCINPRITKNGTYWDPSTTFSADCLNSRGVRVTANISNLNMCAKDLSNINGALVC
jgi:hypothetical protein